MEPDRDPRPTAAVREAAAPSLPAKEIVLLALTLVVGVLTLGSGRATVMQGAVHLVLFAAFVFPALVP